MNSLTSLTLLSKNREVFQSTKFDATRKKIGGTNRGCFTGRYLNGGISSSCGLRHVSSPDVVMASLCAIAVSFTLLYQPSLTLVKPPVSA
jgi:hypothetical protein